MLPLVSVLGDDIIRLGGLINTSGSGGEADVTFKVKGSRLEVIFF